MKLSTTTETLTFEKIGGPVRSRGSAQADIELQGLTYLRQAGDAVTNAAVQIEPRLRMHVPSRVLLRLGATAVSQGIIPHGDSFSAQGNFFPVNGGPALKPVDSTPVKNPAGPPFLQGYLDPVLNL
ncbi:MAG: hypothetical protein KGM43_09940 [Planctomycetota bacterium]|nr:hypothetical protein [Planctomycetota bacterium]